ncbi:MAG: TetR/AcrR family transcriptional regulator [Sandarakinorhabdus sp.]|nr:TetR/AcrR family transcriptional regulator [Sandarakinorhabdus sp.]
MQTGLKVREAPAGSSSAGPDADLAGPPKLDGRRERSVDSRRRILSAMVELVESGVPAPTAESVAARAGVSLRTVFRHFEEMEKLHLEIAALVFERVRPIIDRPFGARTWPEVLHEAIARRSEFFEILSPFKTAIDVYRHRSRAIADEHHRIGVMSRELLAAALPSAIVADRNIFELLNLLLSIEAWQRLRDQQGLSVADATATVRRGAEAVVAQSGVRTAG